MTRRYHKPKDNKKGWAWAAALWAMAGGIGYHLLTNKPETKYQAVKEPAKIETRVSQYNKPQPSIVNQAPSKPSGLENKVLEAEKKAKAERPSETKKTEALAQYSKPIDAAVVVCSNQNYLYAQLNLAELKRNNYTDSDIQEVKINGAKYYRTIVGCNIENLESLMKELIKKRLVGDPKEYFTIKDKAIAKFITESPEKSTKRIEKMESDFRKTVKDKSKDEFVSFMTPVIDELYTKDTLQGSKIKEITSYIYDAAKEFKVPLMDYTAMIAQESSFRNTLGDTNYSSNFSEGYIQMRNETQKFVFQKMKEQGIKDLPSRLPDDLRKYPGLQFRMGAWYFAYCLKEAGWDGKSVPTNSYLIKRGIGKYNAGHASIGPNPRYTNKVDEHKKKITSKASSYSPSSF